MSLPSAVGLPAEMQLGTLDYSLPSDAKSYSVRVQPSNLSQIVSASQALTASSTLDNLSFPAQNIIFDIPCGQSPSTFLANAMSTISFRATITTASGSSSAAMTSAFLRSHANAFFDRMYLVAQNGNIIEDIDNYGLVNDTAIALQMSNSVRDGVANQFGFLSSTAIDNQGHALNVLGGSAGRTLATTAESQVNSYAVPLLSGCIGVLADKNINIGRTSRMQLVLVTSNVLPYSIVTGSATTAGSFVVTLSDFSLGLEYVDVGLNALQMLDQTLVDGKAYIHGTTYRTATATIPATTSGNQSLLVGIRASSVKSLFARFYDANVLSSVNGKYDSKNPSLNSVNWSIGGIKFPQSQVNPLLSPAQAFRETQMAMGSWNNFLFTSGITPANYCKLSAGGTTPAFTSTTTDINYTTTQTSTNAQAQFIFGVNTETIMRRGLMSGYNCTAAPIFLECNIASSLTYTNTLFGIGYLDSILIHDVRSGDIQVRI